MALEFNPDIKSKVEWAVSRYPRKEAAMLPVLHLAQQQFGYISPEVMELVGRTLGVPVNRVQDVVSFYTMFYEKPVGRYHIQVCHTLSCSLGGASQVVDYLESRCGVRCGEGPSPDGRFSISRVECLGSCGTAPMMQVNEDYYENLTKAKIDELIDQWKKG